MEEEPLVARAEYTYTAIQHPNSIRLLSIQPPTSPQSSLQIMLQEYRLDDSPEFIALSYTWATEDGDVSLSKYIGCDGAVIRITPNCEAIIRKLRLPNEARILWVDAACIDSVQP